MEPAAQQDRDVALYSGVSNRSRGWKSRKLNKLMAGRQAHLPGIQRWDGRARTSVEWNCLRRDPELWFRSGNCFVHLHRRGQSRRSPAFRVPFSTLLAAQCRPLIEKYIARDLPTDDASDSGFPLPAACSAPLATLDNWSRAHLLGRVDLYIPPSADADKDETLAHQLIVRNFFAWVFRRPMAGHHLGRCLSALFDVMNNFRSASADNVQDMHAYLKHQGYLAMTGHPEHALAVLHLAESMQNRELYIDAFAHCVGMYEDLCTGTEFKDISSVSQKLIRRARLDMDARLGAAGKMLSTFLDEELSETFLGLPGPARAHLDRFRTYILGFYATRMGYYPPKSISSKSTIFEPKDYATLAADFEALYEYLVDDNFTAGSESPSLAQGGPCILQSVGSFDARHNFPSLGRPLPLLPEVTPQANTLTGDASPASMASGKSNKRMSVLGAKAMGKLHLSRTTKTRPNKKLLAQAALLRAANITKVDVMHNDLVCAYRRFEEDSVLYPPKTDRQERISMVDARKVRWILVYAVHQTLCRCYLPPPPEVHNPELIPYHVGISTNNLPPWQGDDESRQASPPSSPLTVAPSAYPAAVPTAAALENEAGNSGHDYSGAGPSSPTTSITEEAGLTVVTATAAAPELTRTMDDMSGNRPVTPVYDICPDIDYLGLANRQNNTATTTTDIGTAAVIVLPSPPSRSRSLSRTLSRNSAFRRSFSLFRSNSNARATAMDTAAQAAQAAEVPLTSERLQLPPQPTFREILLDGYGNGTSLMVTDPNSLESADATATAAAPSTCRTLSTASTNSNTSSTSDASAATAATAATDITNVTVATTVSTESDREAPAYSTAACDAVMTESPTESEPPVSRPVSFVEGFKGLGSLAVSFRGRSQSFHSPSSLSLSPSPPGPGPLRSRTVYATTNSVPTSSTASSRRLSMRPTRPTLFASGAASSSKNHNHRRFSVYGDGNEYAAVVPPSYHAQPWHHRLADHEGLQCVRESMELQTQQPPQPNGANLRTATTQLHRHSSYHGYRGCLVADKDVQPPEWEKFGMGLGGLTVPSRPAA